jgi:hypothetical protein
MAAAAASSYVPAAAGEDGLAPVSFSQLFGAKRGNLQYMAPEQYKPIDPQGCVRFREAGIHRITSLDELNTALAMDDANRPKQLYVVNNDVEVPYNLKDRDRPGVRSKDRDRPNVVGDLFPSIMASHPGRRPFIPFQHSFEFAPQTILFSDAVEGKMGNFVPQEELKQILKRKDPKFNLKNFQDHHKTDWSEAKIEITAVCSAYCKEKAYVDPNSSQPTMLDQRCVEDLRKVVEVEQAVIKQATHTWKVDDEAKIDEWLKKRVKKFDFVDKPTDSEQQRALTREKCAALVAMVCPFWRSVIRQSKDVQIDPTDTDAVVERMTAVGERLKECKTIKEVVDVVLKHRIGTDGREVGIVWTHHLFTHGAFSNNNAFIPASHLNDPTYGEIIAMGQKTFNNYVPFPVWVYGQPIGNVLPPRAIDLPKGTLIIPYGTFAVYDNTTNKQTAYLSMRALLDGVKIVKQGINTLEFDAYAANKNGTAVVAAGGGKSVDGRVALDMIEDSIDGYENEEYQVREFENVLHPDDKKMILAQLESGELTKQKQAIKAADSAAKNREQKGLKPRANALTYTLKPVPALMPPSSASNGKAERKETSPSNSKAERKEPRIDDMDDGLGAALADIDMEQVQASQAPAAATLKPPAAAAASSRSPRLTAAQPDAEPTPSPSKPAKKRKIFGAPSDDEDNTNGKSASKAQVHNKTSHKTTTGKTKSTSASKRQKRVEEDEAPSESQVENAI